MNKQMDERKDGCLELNPIRQLPLQSNSVSIQVSKKQLDNSSLSTNFSPTYHRHLREKDKHHHV